MESPNNTYMLPQYFGQMADDWYPFAAPSDFAELHQCIADLYLTYTSPEGDTPTLYVENLEASAGQIWMDVATADGDTVISPTGDPNVTDWGPWRTFEWVEGDVVLRVVCERSQLEAMDLTLADQHLPLLARTVDARHSRVELITFDEYDEALEMDVPRVLTGDIVLAPGYNMEMEASDGVIRLDCIPGAGEGRAPQDCNETPDLWAINGVSADANGDFRLEFADCYWAEAIRPTGSSSGDESVGLKLNFDCGSCTDCQEITAAYKRLQVLHGRAVKLGGRLTAAVEYYEYLHGLVEVVQSEMAETKVELLTEQQTDTSYLVLVTVQTGDKTVSRVNASVAYGDVNTTASYFNYSGHEKLPGQRSRQDDTLYNGWNLTPAIPFAPNQWPWWFWHIGFTRLTEHGGTVTITLTITLYDENGDPIAGFNALEIVKEVTVATVEP